MTALLIFHSCILAMAFKIVLSLLQNHSINGTNLCFTVGINVSKSTWCQNNDPVNKLMIGNTGHNLHTNKEKKSSASILKEFFVWDRQLKDYEYPPQKHVHETNPKLTINDLIFGSYWNGSVTGKFDFPNENSNQAQLTQYIHRVRKKMGICP